VREFFQQQFPDVVPLIKDLVDTFFTNPVGTMSTVKSYPWNVTDKALLIGDAAHAIVPFFGQGMNAGFEDCSVFYDCLKEYQDTACTINWSKLFSDFVHLRKTNTDAIADMAVENFFEIHNKVANPQFQMKKKVEGVLEKRFSKEYFSRYFLVAFSCIPYRVASDVGLINDEVLSELCKNLTDVNQLDLEQAKRLIDAKLTPILKEYAKELGLSNGTW
jgi:kynurenine 3-monooxygenase